MPHRSRTSLPVSGSRTRLGCKSFATPIRRAESSSTSSTRTTLPTSRCYAGRCSSPTQWWRATPCPVDRRWLVRLCRLAVAGNAHDTPTDRRHVQPGVTAVARRGHAPPRRDRAMHALAGAGARSVRAGHAREGTCPVRVRRRPGCVRRRAHHRSSDVRGQHSSVDGDTARPRRRDVRGPRRFVAARRVSRPSDPRRTDLSPCVWPEWAQQDSNL